MKPVENLIRDNIKNLKPCVHGGEVLDAAYKSGLKHEEILDFSSSVNPLGPRKKRLKQQKTGLSRKFPVTQTQTQTNFGKPSRANFSCIHQKQRCCGEWARRN